MAQSAASTGQGDKSLMDMSVLLIDGPIDAIEIERHNKRQPPKSSQIEYGPKLPLQRTRNRQLSIIVCCFVYVGDARPFVPTVSRSALLVALPAYCALLLLLFFL